MVHANYDGASAGRGPEIAREIGVNLTAPISLSVAMLPTLLAAPRPFIANVTSGLVLAPIAGAVVYCATKAGLRSFTKGLRDQLAGGGHDIQLTEGIMALVDTTLSQGDPARKISPEIAARESLAGIAAGKREVAVCKVRLLRAIWLVSPAFAERIMRGF